MSFEFETQRIKDVILVKPKIIRDSRGFLMETYKKSEFEANGISIEFMQENYSKSSKGVLRGLHYQSKPHEQAKLIRCIKGKIYDVAVDIRTNSKTFGEYVMAELSEENGFMLYIPKGFAHGFLAISEEVEIQYKMSSEYAPETERGILWCDKDINIDWKLDFEPILSDKDKEQPTLREVFK